MSAWFRIRSIGTSLRQSPAAAVYLLPLVVGAALCAHYARTPALHAAMTWRAIIVTIYWVVFAIWMSLGPLTRLAWFDVGRLTAQLIGTGLLGLILGTILRPADSISLGHLLLYLSAWPSIAWTTYACDADGCRRLLALTELIREDEPYASHVMFEGSAAVVPANRGRNLRVCAWCGVGRREHRWTRDPAKYIAMVNEETAKITDPKKQKAVRIVYWTLGTLLFVALWGIDRLRARLSALIPGR